jgi:hypothetical protein
MNNVANFLLKPFGHPPEKAKRKSDEYPNCRQFSPIPSITIFVRHRADCPRFRDKGESPSLLFG